jgi:AcrR family transcriptional regulator
LSVPTGRRQATKAANRAAILEAARTAFGEYGYGATTVRDIVRGTDLASGTFYNYFPDKESVFRELIVEVGDEARSRVRAARAAAETLDSFVADGYRAYFSFIVEDPARFAFMARNAGTIRFLFGEHAVPAGVEDLAEDLRAAIDAEQIPPLDVDYCSHTMIGAGLELAQRLMEREPPDVEGATRFATDLFLGGLERMARSASGG